MGKRWDKVKAIKRASRIETGGPHGKAGAHVDKRERRLRRLSTQEWLEEAEDDDPGDGSEEPDGSEQIP